MFVKPRDGIKIFCPTTRVILDPNGSDKGDDLTYWVRAAQAGDVTISDAAPASVEEQEQDA